jgi:hypothetical protein
MACLPNCCDRRGGRGRGTSTAPTVPSASSRAGSELGGFDHEHRDGIAVRALI